MENSLAKVSLSSMVKKRAYHQLVVIFTKENMDEDKPFPVINIPPVRFIGGSTRQVRTGSIQRSWDP